MSSATPLLETLDGEAGTAGAVCRVGARTETAMAADEARERAKAVWGAGDYGPASQQLEPAAKAPVETLAIAAARRGAEW